MENDFLEVVKSRRSYYSIGKGKIVSDNSIAEIVTEAVKYAPSAFNSQSARVLLLLNEHHDKFWEIVKNELRQIVPAESFENSKQKIDNCFKNGYGTILYFEDMDTVKDLQQKYPLYSENFPIWSNQSSGMLQFIIWSALEKEGLGASLQHYNPLIDIAVKKEWGVPDNYKLIAQMPFGKPLSKPDEKTFMPIEQRFKLYK